LLKLLWSLETLWQHCSQNGRRHQGKVIEPGFGVLKAKERHRAGFWSIKREISFSSKTNN
jgi:hypothetical protein